MADLMFPVYIYQENLELPKEGTYFVVAGNGAWLRKDTGLVRCFVPVENISFLPDLNANVQLECSLPKIPEDIVWKVKEFFRRVVDLHHAESEITLYYNKTTKDYKVVVPNQVVTHSSVRYSRSGMIHLEEMKDYLRVGTIHSHCDFGAFHSGTDEGDEIDFDGLHVTFGHNNKDEFSISASIVVNGYRSKVDPLTVLEGITVASIHDRYILNPLFDSSNCQNEIDGWLTKVRSDNNFAVDLESSDFSVGDKIQWSDLSLNSHFRFNIGEGPFEVLGINGDCLEISTKLGNVNVFDFLFKKVGS